MASEGQKRNKIKKKRSFLLHLLERAVFSICWNVQGGGGGGGGGGGENKIYRERKSNFSLDFPAFGPSVLVGPRSKVVLRSKGYAWAPILRSFDNSETRGLLLLSYFRF